MVLSLPCTFQHIFSGKSQTWSVSYPFLDVFFYLFWDFFSFFTSEKITWVRSVALWLLWWLRLYSVSHLWPSWLLGDTVDCGHQCWSCYCCWCCCYNNIINPCYCSTNCPARVPSPHSLSCLLRSEEEDWDWQSRCWCWRRNAAMLSRYSTGNTTYCTCCCCSTEQTRVSARLFTNHTNQLISPSCYIRLNNILTLWSQQGQR